MDYPTGNDIVGHWKAQLFQASFQLLSAVDTMSYVLTIA